MNETRFTGYSLPIIKIMSWHDNDLNLEFYDLYLDGNFASRCSDKKDLMDHLSCIISAYREDELKKIAGGNRS